MKNILSFFLVLLTLSKGLCVFSIEDTCPKWEEFVPEKYLNANYDVAEIEFQQDKPLIILSTISIVAAPYGYYRLIKGSVAKKNNYWYKRRLAFENEVATCNNVKNKDERYACYMEIRKMEETKNMHFEDLEMKRNQINTINNYRMQN